MDLSKVDFPTTVTFAEKLAEEEGVLVLPSEAFMSSSGFRLVLCQPIYVIEECMERIKALCLRHLISS